MGLVMLLADLTQQHVDWLLLNIGMTYSAMAGAATRLLLVRGEPFMVRLQNSLAGIILALVLAPATAVYFNQLNYVNGYAFIYGMVARELVLSFVETVNDKAIPLYHRLLDAIPFLNSNTKDKDKSNDATDHD